MENKKQYDILELQKMSIIDLTSIADQANISIQNNMKQSLIYAILDNQNARKQQPADHHSRDRYAIADKITETYNFHPGLHDYSNRL